jgi:homoserine kinase
MLKPAVNQVTAFAPATSANLGVGFDILGLALSAVGDTVTLTKRSDRQIVIEKINSPTGLPLEPQKNTASFALTTMCQALDIPVGFNLTIDKGIAMGSGMGGSDASAVAAVVALNGFLEQPVSRERLVEFALAGEEIASGGRHADNVAPCVFGGITLIRSLEPIEVISLPIPALQCVIVHPHLQVETKSARKILSPTVALKQYIAQSAQLAATISALYQQDLQLFSRSLQDLIIEPQRASLVAGFAAAKHAALTNGALGFTLSGSGPSVIAFAATSNAAQKVCQAIIDGFLSADVNCDSWISPINPAGAQIINHTSAL